MKKRCTNSKCRKVFQAETHKCPHCGKKYPRERVGAKNHAVILTIPVPRSMEMLHAISACTGIGVWKLFKLGVNRAVLVRKGMLLSQAIAMRDGILAAGADAKIIPDDQKTVGIFIRPKKAG